MAALVAFVIFLFVGKGYYIGPLHPVLLAAGACAVEFWARRAAAGYHGPRLLRLVVQAVVLLADRHAAVFPESVMARSVSPRSAPISPTRSAGPTLSSRLPRSTARFRRGSVQRP